MPFVSSPSAQALQRVSNLGSNFVHRSRPYPHVRSSARTPAASALPNSPPATNFFLNTTLRRIPSTAFPNDIDHLLDAVSDADRFIPIWNDKPLIHSDPNQPPLSSPNTPSVSAVLWTRTRLKSWLRQMRQNAPPQFSPLTVTLAQTTTLSSPVNYFAVDVSHSATAPTSDNQSVSPLRTMLSLLETETEASLVAHAKSLLSWHNSATYCSRCGNRTAVTQGGAARACLHAPCKTRNIYPRVMPSVLVLVLRNTGQEVLLGRKASWAPNRFSVLAGFAEIFESLEQTVAREVFEETGVVVDETTIEYHSSQPWPSSPQASLMSGFRAHVTNARNAQITVDHNELEDAQWFRKDWLLQNLGSNPADRAAISIPGHTSLARRLIMEWLHEVEGNEIPSAFP